MAKATKRIGIEIDPETGKVRRTEPAETSVAEIPMENLTLAEKKDGVTIHHKIVYVPEYTVIHTKSNPECRWVFIMGQWVRVCT